MVEMVDSQIDVMSWAARTEQRKDAGSVDIGLKYRRDRGRRDATVRSRSPTERAGCHIRTSRLA
jgi:hypothetical protein